MRLIDADTLFEKVGNIKPNNKSEYELLGKFMNMITYSQTVFIPTAELDTTNDFAEWIDVNSDGSIMKCSRCGEEVCCKDNNFCSNCGARMVKEGEETC